jgi:hypothetical protein
MGCGVKLRCDVHAYIQISLAAVGCVDDVERRAERLLGGDIAWTEFAGVATVLRTEQG